MMEEVECLQCYDTGFVPCTGCDGKGETEGFMGYNTKLCEPCRGRGLELCPLCDGGGRKMELLQLLHQAPPGQLFEVDDSIDHHHRESKRDIRMRALGGLLGLFGFNFFFWLGVGSGFFRLLEFDFVAKSFLGITFVPMFWFGLQVVTGSSSTELRRRWPDLTPGRLMFLLIGFAMTIFFLVFLVWVAWVWLTIPKW